MTYAEKVKFVREERFEELNAWCKEFISDVYDNVQDDEELTQRQMDKIDEIWEDLGL